MTEKPYQDQLEELSPKDFIRYLKDEKNKSFQEIGDTVVPHQKTASGRRGTAKKMYDLPSESDYAHKFTTEKSKEKVRDELEESELWDDIDQRMRYSREDLGGLPAKSGTPKAAIVFYFKPERTIEECEELAEKFDTNGARINYKWDWREITSTDKMREGASIIQTDKRKGTYHAQLLSGEVWTIQTTLENFMDRS